MANLPVPVVYHLTTTLRNMSRRHFSQASYLYPGLRHLVYTGTPSSPINIERWGDQEALWDKGGKTAAVFLRRNSCQFTHNGVIDNGLEMQVYQGNEEDVPPGDVHERLVVSSCTLFCLSLRAAESELIAFELAEHFGHFSSAIRAQLCLHRFRVVELGVTGKIREAPLYFATPVTIGYSANEVYRIEEQSPRLRAVDINLENP